MIPASLPPDVTNCQLHVSNCHIRLTSNGKEVTKVGKVFGKEGLEAGSSRTFVTLALARSMQVL